MNRPCLFLAATLLLLATGCATTAPPGGDAPDADTTEASDATTAFAPRAARVFVDGRDRGLTPRTVRVRRSFGASEVALVAGGAIERTYVLQRTASADSRSLDYSFWDGANDSNTFDAATLPHTKSGALVVPYSPYAITIHDRQYNLVLLVTE